LQVMRLSEDDEIVRLVAMSEQDALSYLRTGIAPTEPRPPTVKTERRRT
jgi:hypothetical protein